MALILKKNGINYKEKMNYITFVNFCVNCKRKILETTLKAQTQERKYGTWNTIQVYKTIRSLRTDMK